MIKILITSNRLPPYAGGAEQVAWETAKRLAKIKDVEVSVLTTEGKKFHIFKREGVLIYSIPFVRQQFLELYYLTKGARRLKQFLPDHFDIIHFHIARPFPLLLSSYHGKKIITCHGEDVYHNKLWKGIYMKYVLSRATFVLSSSKFLKKIITSKYHLPVTLFPNGVDTSFFKPSNKQSHKNMILYVGRYTERKGLLEFLEVVRKLPKYQFYFVGEGPLYDHLVGENIINLGFKQGEDLIKLYQQATLCVFPSHWENFPLVGLEALACGKPLIATTPGFSEFIISGKEGILVPPKETKPLKKSLIKLMRNPRLRAQLAKNARKKALFYDWNVIVEKYLSFYKELLKKR